MNRAAMETDGKIYKRNSWSKGCMSSRKRSGGLYRKKAEAGASGIKIDQEKAGRIAAKASGNFREKSAAFVVFWSWLSW